ncbi:sensor histidine kinase [Streptomyces sp. 6N223]|uniref:sensor histidine kinase n=1 Tax=Streptomyces sp. 6N223 TaxID=3457412 RepID=UPI003FD15EB4
MPRALCAPRARAAVAAGVAAGAMLFAGPPLPRYGGLTGAAVVVLATWIAGEGLAPRLRLRAALAAGAVAEIQFLGYRSMQESLDGTSALLMSSDLRLFQSLHVAEPVVMTSVALAAWALAGRVGRGLPLRVRMALVVGVGTLGAVSAWLAFTTSATTSEQWFVAWTPAGLEWVFLYLAQAAAMAVACVAWLTAGRALRPVEGIRRELEDITLRSLDRRVPVPRGGDELTRLALTTNAILDRLERATETQQQFIADASHELRSPVAAVRASLESLLAHPEDVDWPTAVRSALRDLKRLQSLSEDLLLLARLDGNAPLLREPVNVTDLVHDLVEEHRHQRHGRLLEIRCRANGVPVWVRGSDIQLERMLRNLLNNACRYARTTVQVDVAVDGGTGVGGVDGGARPGTVRIDVRDDGPGIPAGDRERVFERFSRLEDARTRKSGGAGLGLAIAREIADRHGGTLRFADAAGGAHAVGRLPALAPPAPTT